MNDLISRQAALDTIKDFKQGAAEWKNEQEEDSDIWHRADSAIASALEIGLRIKKLPSAQTESLTDKEQRIFLAAMGREEEVCKEVDEECRYCREPYEDSLVRVCHQITRKVKGALWT